MSTKPNIVSRNGWGAAPASGQMDAIGAVNYSIIHHTDTPNYETGSTAAQRVKNIQYYHMNTNKWSDIAYHFLIADDGIIYEGRSIQYAGAHCVGRNSDSIGIALLGTFNSVNISKAQERSLTKLLGWLTDTRFNIPTDNIKGHRDYNSTDCPGSQLYSYLEPIRNDVINFIFSGSLPS